MADYYQKLEYLQCCNSKLRMSFLLYGFMDGNYLIPYAEMKIHLK